MWNRIVSCFNNRTGPTQVIAMDASTCCPYGKVGVGDLRGSCLGQRQHAISPTMLQHHGDEGTVDADIASLLPRWAGPRLFVMPLDRPVRVHRSHIIYGRKRLIMSILHSDLCGWSGISDGRLRAELVSTTQHRSSR